MGSRHSVLVVDDDIDVGRSLFRTLKQAGYDVRHVASGESAVEVVDEARFDVVLTDLRMPGMGGMGLLAALRDIDATLPVIMFTAHGSIPLAVEAMRLGAKDFLTKPVDREELLHVIATALSMTEATQNAPPEPPSGAGGIVGSSKAITDCLELVNRAAKVTATVLVRGESGSGKELVARAIHDRSGRSGGPFIPVHCAALADNLIEAELFGHAAHAFTDAGPAKPGRVELAQAGTLFLDEVGDIPLSTQVKLLRLLAAKEYTPVGGTETRQADVRFVAATHRDLEAMVAAGTFREDLYHRVNVISVTLPPLRERGEDIAELANHFVAQLADANQRPGMRFGASALTALAAHPFPGNVRELANLVERLVVFTDADVIEAADVEGQLRGSRPASPSGAPDADGTFEEQTNDVKRRVIADALRRAGGNKTKAARLIGISRRTLYNWISDLEMG